MSDTKEPYKWYWAYESSSNDKIYLFHTFDEAYRDAIGHGEFEDCFGKDAWYSRQEDMFFEIREDEIQEYSNVELILNEVA